MRYIFHYPFLKWWTSRLFPISGYSEQNSNVHGKACVSAVDYSPLGISLRVVYLDLEAHQFSEKLPHWFPQKLYRFTLPPTKDKCFPFPTPLATCLQFISLNFVILTVVRWNLKAMMIWISLDVEHLSVSQPFVFYPLKTLFSSTLILIMLFVFPHTSGFCF